MKKKRLLALTLAASMVFSSISWADTDVPRQQGDTDVGVEQTQTSEKKETASPSDAEHPATMANALRPANTEKATFTISTVSGSNTVRSFDKLELRITGEMVPYENYRLFFKNPRGTARWIATFSSMSNGGNELSDISDVTKDFNKNSVTMGKYQFYMVDDDDNVIGELLEIEVVKRPTLKVELKEQFLTKRYGNKDPEVFPYWRDSEMQAFDPATGEPMPISTLHNLRYERQQGEDPGKYTVTKLSSDEVEEIQLIENEYSQFEITKKERSLYTTSVDLLQTDSEQNISIPGTFHLMDKDIPDKVILGELTEEEKAYFTELPVVDGLNIKFKLKKMSDSYSVRIPFALESKYCIYKQNGSEELGLTVQAGMEKFVARRSVEEIKAFYAAHPFSTGQNDRWAVTPSISDEIPGKLSDATVENALNSLNFVRYIAGIPSNVTNNETYENYAQAGTTLLTRVNDLTHTPKKPQGVSDEFYELGYKGTSSSNLGMGHSNLSEDILYGWMNDKDPSNIETVGHRRWCLDPNMTQTGFGHSGSFTAMYAFDDMNDKYDYDYDYIPWPAQTMPLDYFYGPWMVSLSHDRYDVYSEDEDQIRVTLTSKNKGKTYTLDSSDKNKKGKYFNLSMGGYGYGPALIFEPNVSFSSGDEVTVNITGLKNRYGGAETIEYTVKFFKLSGSSGGGGGDSSSGGGGGGGSSSGGGGGGGSSSGGGGGGGGSAAGGPGGGTKTGTLFGKTTLPDYVIKGTWTTAADGNWKFADSTGTPYISKWAAVENPYANSALGQQAFDWFYFDGAGNMVTGWYKEADGTMYYLNPASDGTRGKMVTGWAWIPDQNGVKKCYYFNPNSDGFRGKMMTNTVIDGNTLNVNGEWVVNGVVQTQ